MNPQALAKLDLLTAAKEVTLQEALARHSAALQRYEAQRAVLMDYQNRLSAGWQGGDMVSAGDALRATQFSVQAKEASLQLEQSIKAEQDKRDECAAMLANTRSRRNQLQERMKFAAQVEMTKAQEKAERNRPVGFVSAQSDMSIS